jgi:hypothetical protein
MKFCKSRICEYEGLSGTPTTTKYVSYEDVASFHGDNFAKQWLDFIKDKPTLILDKQKYYYYVDYKHFAIATDMYVNCA